MNPHFSRFHLLLLVVKMAGIAVCFVQGPSSVQYSDVEPAEAMILFLASPKNKSHSCITFSAAAAAAAAKKCELEASQSIRV